MVLRAHRGVSLRSRGVLPPKKAPQYITGVLVKVPFRSFCVLAGAPNCTSDAKLSAVSPVPGADPTSNPTNVDIINGLLSVEKIQTV